VRSDEEITRLVSLFPENWRRFCDPGPMGCGCMGCVSVPAPYMKAGIPPSEYLTKEEMERWEVIDKSEKRDKIQSWEAQT
jgi:hypothetical protein